jgi:transglutaminase-like putative cysteine protease
VTWRIRVEHRSTYRYAKTAHTSYNEARVTPLTTPTQMVLDAAVTVTPPARTRRYWDYWGTAVHVFDLHEPHEQLDVWGKSVVETMVAPLRRSAVSWADLRSDIVRDDFAELLSPTSQVPVDARLLQVAADMAGDGDPHDAATAAVNWVRSHLAYVPGSTGVHTSAVEAWEGGRGVCQDYAHLTLALLRGMGIPARYCSGYLHPNADAGFGVEMAGESHAWIEWWGGEWYGVDPTIGWPVGERHVLVARGRDYHDVAPVRGVYHGGPTAALEVEVSLTRIG